MRYVFVYGGVFSGIGKGVIAASIARILKSRGANVSVVKIDPYLNYDAGTLRPTEHGEVWVTWDGIETDMDLGTYERFLGERISGKNNITSGKVYFNIISDERAGKFLGKTVQIIPHLIERIKKMIRSASTEKDVVIVEIGGVVGDYENIPYLVAAKDIELQEGKENVAHVLVAYFPVPPHLGEMKTKPAQHAVRHLSSVGIFPDFLIGRAPVPLDEERKMKMELTTHIPAQRVFSVPDVENIYKIPLLLEKQGVGEELAKMFGLGSPCLDDWEKRVANMENPKDEVDIVLVGKYVLSGSFKLPDAYVSIREALFHVWADTGIKPNLIFVDTRDMDENMLRDAHGIIVPGGFGTSGIDEKIRAIRIARENDIPYLGLCLGLQLAVVEIMRNVVGLHDAHTTEVDPKTPHPVVDLLPEQKNILEQHRLGGSMRLGEYAAALEENTKVFEAYAKSTRFREAEELKKIFVDRNEHFRIGKTEGHIVFERHRHRYEVNPAYHDALRDVGVVLSGKHIRLDGQVLLEFMELSDHPFFVATQAHPEYKSWFEDPAPIFRAFVLAACKKG